jgi:hypothetical protein
MDGQLVWLEWERYPPDGIKRWTATVEADSVNATNVDFKKSLFGAALTTPGQTVIRAVHTFWDAVSSVAGVTAYIELYHGNYENAYIGAITRSASAWNEHHWYGRVDTGINDPNIVATTPLLSYNIPIAYANDSWKAVIEAELHMFPTSAPTETQPTPVSLAGIKRPFAWRA